MPSLKFNVADTFDDLRASGLARPAAEKFAGAWLACFLVMARGNIFAAFTLEHAQLPDFAAVSLGPLTILLSGHGASGSRRMPSGEAQEPGGWNRVVLRVKDLASCIEELKQAGLRFRNEMETGPGGKQIQLEDPDGNPIELFEPGQRKH